MKILTDVLNYGFKSLGITIIIIVIASFILKELNLLSDSRNYYLLLFVCATVGKYFRLKINK